MQSITCPECNLTDWAEAIVCKRCGYAFQAISEEEFPEENHQEQFDEFGGSDSQEAQFEESYYEEEGYEEEAYEEGAYEEAEDYSAAYPDPSVAASKPKLNSRMAITSLVLSIVANPYFASFWGTIVVMFLLLAVGTTAAIAGAVVIILLMPLGLILGIVAFVKSKKYPNEFGGKGLAVAGMITSTAGILLLALTLGTIVPGIYSGYMTVVEGQAVEIVKNVIHAQKAYRSKTGGNCASLQELAANRIVDGEVGEGQKGEYRFIIAMLPNIDGGCEVFAVPKKNSWARKSFFYSTEDDTLRAAEKNGELASKDDPTIDPNEYVDRLKRVARK